LLKGRYRWQIIKKEGYIREAFRGHYDCVFWGSFSFLGVCSNTFNESLAAVVRYQTHFDTSVTFGYPERR
jgi:hypothetical protein